ncbi:MAG: hypothetical protein RIQ52_8 [Pseudomonadota bacterium]|jgi:3-dehydroquinate dehydratase-2
MARILVLNGPNLNLLGTREPGIYGACTLAEIEHSLQEQARTLNHEIDFFQSNVEGLLVDRIHRARDEQTDFIIINPAAYTHTSIALRDAFLATQIPFIEVHLSNVYAREPFRAKSYLSDIARGVICGLGPVGYKLALQATLEI